MTLFYFSSRPLFFCDHYELIITTAQLWHPVTLCVTSSVTRDPLWQIRPAARCGVWPPRDTEHTGQWWQLSKRDRRSPTIRIHTWRLQLICIGCVSKKVEHFNISGHRSICIEYSEILGVRSKVNSFESQFIASLGQGQARQPAVTGSYWESGDRPVAWEESEQRDRGYLTLTWLRYQ